MESSDAILNPLKELMTRRLLNIPAEQKSSFPMILSKEKVIPFMLLNKNYFVLVFVDENELSRIRALMAENRDPFPYLIRPQNIHLPVAFRFETSRYAVIKDSTVKNSFSFSLGKDSTLILIGFKQIIDLAKAGEYEYLIDLAYIISFGDEINLVNLPDVLDNLIAYSIKFWRGEDGKIS